MLKPKALMPFIGQMVRVVWDDAADVEGTWKESADLHKTENVKVVSVGHLVVVRPDLIVVAGDHIPTESRFSQIGSIPLGCVVSVELLATVEDDIEASA